MSAETTKRVARVLSISGDGARTAIAAHVLAELERQTGQPVHKLFHMIVGEGAGAVLAMAVGVAVTDAVSEVLAVAVGAVFAVAVVAVLAVAVGGCLGCGRGGCRSLGRGRRQRSLGC